MRNIHNYVQIAAVFMLAGAAWGLTHNRYWGLCVLGVALLAWSVMAEMAQPVKRKRAGVDLREVP